MIKDIDLIKNYTFEEIKENGFPYYQFEPKKYLKMFMNLRKIQEQQIFVDENTLNYNKFVSMFQLATVFFPQMFNVRINGKKRTPLYIFENELEKLIDKLYKIYGKNNARIYHIRKFSKIFNGVQSAGNFNPVVAKVLYDKFGNNGKVLDFSSGWGGRLVGFLASYCKEYVGVDVNSSLFDGYREIIKHYNIYNKKVIMLKQGSETLLDYTNVEIGDKNFKLKENYFDYALTSPPYFNKEYYSNDSEQSFLKYPDYEDWLNNYLFKTLRNVETLLKPGAYYMVNIAPIKSGKKVYNIVEDIIKNYKEPVKIYDMIVTVHFFGKSTKFKERGNWKKTEPLLVFKKDGVLEKNKTGLEKLFC